MTTSHIPYLAVDPTSVTKVRMEDGQILPSPFNETLLVHVYSTEASDRAERGNSSSCKRIQHSLFLLTAVRHTNGLLKAVMHKNG
jgi:hypothetical protein